MAEAFTRHIFRVILARVALQKGFATIQQPAMDILIDVIITRLSDIARTASRITAQCGRTDTNGLDTFAALFKFRENPTTLRDYLHRPDQFPPFEFLIEPYPLPRISPFYTATGSLPSGRTTPFRANSVFIPRRGDRHIPAFFPPPPDLGTAEKVAEVGPAVSQEPKHSWAATKSTLG
jgi:hypothetical protein